MYSINFYQNYSKKSPKALTDKDLAHIQYTRRNRLMNNEDYEEVIEKSANYYSFVIIVL